MTLDYRIPGFPVRRSVLRDEMLSGFDAIFDAFFDEKFSSNNFKNQFIQKGSYPKVNIIEVEDRFIFEAAVPGLTKDDIAIEVDDESSLLTISGEAKQNKEYKDLYLCREIKRSKFSRSFSLPKETLDLSKISAQCDNGILTIEIPKLKPEERLPKVRKVTIS